VFFVKYLLPVIFSNYFFFYFERTRDVIFLVISMHTPSSSWRRWNRSEFTWGRWRRFKGGSATTNHYGTSYICIRISVPILSRGIRFHLIKTGEGKFRTYMYYIEEEDGRVAAYGLGRRESHFGHTHREKHHVTNEGEDGSFNLKQVNDKKKRIYILGTISTKSRSKKYSILLGALRDFDCLIYMYIHFL